MSDKEKQLLVSEVNIMRKLRHPNVVRYYDHIVDNASADLYVITEFCANGDLGTLIQTYKLDQYVTQYILFVSLFLYHIIPSRVYCLHVLYLNNFGSTSFVYVC